MSRPLFMFRPNLQNEDHRRAWALLQAEFLCSGSGDVHRGAPAYFF